MQENMYRLQGQAGFEVEVSAMGASLVSAMAPDKNGERKNVVYSITRTAGDHYAGAVIGPSAGRIDGGKLPMEDGSVLQLAQNEGENNLHGGPHNTAFQLWQAQDGASESAVCFEVRLEDGVDGFPGNRRFTARYSIAGPNQLALELTAETDKPTWMDVTSHPYFNLTGDVKKSALRHVVRVPAGQVTVSREDSVPVGQRDVQNTPFDLRDGAVLEERMQQYPEDGQIKQENGYNCTFLLNSPLEENGLRLAACLQEPESGRQLKLHTDAPALVFYSAGAWGVHGDNPLGVFPGCCLALEPQLPPNAVHVEGWPKAYLHPGQVWKRRVLFSFDAM